MEKRRYTSEEDEYLLWEWRFGAGEPKGYSWAFMFSF